MKLAFIFNPGPGRARELAEQLEKRFKADLASPQDADILVPVGGDGSVIYALKHHPGKTVYGIIPPGSRSVGYAANEFSEDEDLQNSIGASDRYPLHPLVATITHKDGTVKIERAYGTFAIERDETQAASLLLSGIFNEKAKTIEVIGDGLVFSTPLGSTALNYSHGGPVLPLDHPPSVIIAGMGLYLPQMGPVVADQRAAFGIACQTPRGGDRPLRLNFDGQSLRPAGPGNRFVHINVNVAPAAEGFLALKAMPHPFRRFFVS